jgi:hypothetical protein
MKSIRILIKKKVTASWTEQKQGKFVYAIGVETVVLIK